MSLEHREPRSSYWMLLAAHGFTALLAARLMGCVRSGQGDDATVVTVELTGM